MFIGPCKFGSFVRIQCAMVVLLRSRFVCVCVSFWVLFRSVFVSVCLCVCLCCFVDALFCWATERIDRRPASQQQTLSGFQCRRSDVFWQTRAAKLTHTKKNKKKEELIKTTTLKTGNHFLDEQQIVVQYINCVVVSWFFCRV